MFHIVLFEPEIPPNTGNIIRLCSNTGCQLHLIKPLGFNLQDKMLRRAGLDYHEFASLKTYDNLQQCLQQLGTERIFTLSTKSQQPFHQARFQAGDVFIFGPESRGLPAEVMQRFPQNHCLRLPMLPDNRSLNLSNCAAIVVYEAWRQNAFSGAL